jgi:hypothetical protein
MENHVYNTFSRCFPTEVFIWNINSVYRLQISMNLQTRPNFNLLCDYFSNIPLKTYKQNDFNLWKTVIEKISLKEHKTSENADF